MVALSLPVVVVAAPSHACASQARAALVVRRWRSANEIVPSSVTFPRPRRAPDRHFRFCRWRSADVVPVLSQARGADARGRIIRGSDEDQLAEAAALISAAARLDNLVYHRRMMLTSVPVADPEEDWRRFSRDGGAGPNPAAEGCALDRWPA